MQKWHKSPNYDYNKHDRTSANRNHPRLIVSQFPSSSLHCINPHCPNPTAQVWGNNFCQSCGTSLRLHDRYIPLKRLGVGGFAVTYVVWDVATRTERVLKVLTEPSAKALELFAQEAAVLSRLNHPGIPAIAPNGYFKVDVRNQMISPQDFPLRSLPCLVMEKIDGETLEAILQEHPQGCPEIWVIIWLNQALDILQELHQRQIIHRDLKPSNLMMRSRPQYPHPPQPPFTQGGGIWRGQLVAIDFGGAKQIGSNIPATSTRLVSPGYSPPEQIAGRPTGPQADFYALGRTCIHLLTGKHPGDLENPRTGELEWRHLVSVHPLLADLLDQMVKAEVDQRPASAIIIQERLSALTQVKKRRRHQDILQQWVWQVTQLVFSLTHQGVKTVFAITWNLTVGTVIACVETTWAMTLGGVGGCVGAVLGLLFAYWLPWGATAIHFVNQELAWWFPELSWQISPAIFVFALAGLGTAVGLTDAGSFQQRRRYGLAASLGGLGYLVMGILWPVITALVGQELAMMAMGIMTGMSVTLGLGLRDHAAIYGLGVGIGAGLGLTLLTSLNLIPGSFFQLFILVNPPSFWEFWSCLLVFGFLGGFTGVLLGLIHYLVVPVWRWLE